MQSVHLAASIRNTQRPAAYVQIAEYTVLYVDTVGDPSANQSTVNRLRFRLGWSSGSIGTLQQLLSRSPRKCEQLGTNKTPEKQATCVNEVMLQGRQAFRLGIDSPGMRFMRLVFRIRTNMPRNLVLVYTAPDEMLIGFLHWTRTADNCCVSHECMQFQLLVDCSLSCVHCIPNQTQFNYANPTGENRNRKPVLDFPVTLSDLEGHLCCLKPFYLPYVENYCIINQDMFAHESESAPCARDP